MAGRPQQASVQDGLVSLSDGPISESASYNFCDIDFGSDVLNPDWTNMEREEVLPMLREAKKRGVYALCRRVLAKAEDGPESLASLYGGERMERGFFLRGGGTPARNNTGAFLTQAAGSDPENGDVRKPATPYAVGLKLRHRRCLSGHLKTKSHATSGGPASA